MEEKLEILIVDDDVDLASNLQDILEAEGYATAAAYDSRIALNICHHKKKFDLAIVDIKLPDTPGMELISKLAEVSVRALYIIITSYASRDNAIEAVKTEKILDYETKPLDMDHFLTLIKQVAERRGAEEALREERDKAQKYLDVTGVMLVAIGNDQKVRLINKKGCLVLACQEGEIVGKNWFDNFIPERFRDEVKAIFNRLIAGEIEPVEYFENPFLTKDGEVAIDIARSQRPDIILMDITMPNIDGYTACSTIKQDPTTKTIPVIMVTAVGQELNKTQPRRWVLMGI